MYTIANFAFAHILLEFTKSAVLQCTIPVLYKIAKTVSIDGITSLCYFWGFICQTQSRLYIILTYQYNNASRVLYVLRKFACVAI